MDTKKCPYCGEEISATEQQCRHCGELLANKEDAKPQYLRLFNILNAKRKRKWIIIGIGILILFAVLPFHYIPGRMMMFPKEHLTFSKTFIFQSDIDNLIDRYNEASFMEKIVIMQEPLSKKLIEKGIIVRQKNK